MPLDLDAYLARIGYRGPREPTLATLRVLHELHPRAIAFEGIDPWLGRPALIDLTSLQSKLVTGRRGGYCYEHNTLFRAALAALGFSVRGLAGRVLYSAAPGGGQHPRTHLLTLLETAQGPYIADVGFGGLTLTAPVKLIAGLEQPTPHETVRLTDEGDDFMLEVRAGGEWRRLYRFGLEEQTVADDEMANWFVSTHPLSPFTGRLIAARALPGKRLALANRQFTVHHLGGDSIKRDLSDVADARRVLETEFGLALPSSPALDARLGQLFLT